MKMNDPILKAIIDKEFKRQQNNIELIASENIVSKDVLEAVGSILTNKYAEGYPEHRYYGGCEFVDQVENLAKVRAEYLFNTDYHINVQPHSGTQANMEVYSAMLDIGDTILSMGLEFGGHLSHSYPATMSGKLYNGVHYGVNKDTGLIDYDEVRQLAIKHKPKLILAGASAYPRKINFEAFKAIADEVGAYFMVDMAHIAGLVATGLHPTPFGLADFVTTTTHKTLRGTRGGMIFCKPEYAKKIDSAVFPKNQGGPLMHVIAGKAVCFLEASQPEFKEYQQNVVNNAKAMAETFINNGLNVITGGTDNHLLLLDLRNINITGKEAEDLLGMVNITVNKNAIPYDPEKPNITSGIRIGTPAVTTRGFTEQDCISVANLITNVLTYKEKSDIINTVRNEVRILTEKYPIYK